MHLSAGNQPKSYQKCGCSYDRLILRISRLSLGKNAQGTSRIKLRVLEMGTTYLGPMNWRISRESLITCANNGRRENPKSEIKPTQLKTYVTKRKYFRIGNSDAIKNLLYLYLSTNRRWASKPSLAANNVR